MKKFKSRQDEEFKSCQNEEKGRFQMFSQRLYFYYYFYFFLFFIIIIFTLQFESTFYSRSKYGIVLDDMWPNLRGA